MSKFLDEIDRDAFTDILEFLKNENAEEYEIEARVGRICEYISQDRICLNTPHAVVFTKQPRGTYFDSGVDKKAWNGLKLKLGSEGRKKKDKVYFFAGNIRKIESEDEEGNVMEKYEIKEKIKNITVYIPWLDYDIRISVSRENTITRQNAVNIIVGSSGLTQEKTYEYVSVSSEEECEKEENIKKRKETLIPEFTRFRERESFKKKEYSYDFTITRKDNSKVDGYNYEIEMEIVDKMYDPEYFIKKIMCLASLEYD